MQSQIEAHKLNMAIQWSLILGLLARLSMLTLVMSRPLTDEDLGIVIGPFEPHELQNPPPPPPPPPPPKERPVVSPPPPEADEPQCPLSNSFSRASFPLDFIFGTATSAFQIEGAKNGLGRGLTTWDDFTHKYADKVESRGDADIATDSYNRYEEDIELMKELNTNGYRFSISWTRILPHGRARKGINEDGIKYYNKLINALKENGIEPSVTLFHWETPLALEEEYEGFLDKRIVKDFRDFARICFERFGDRVKNWATFNEPWVYSVAGYSRGKKAPGRCSKWVNETCIVGDSGTEPYIATHNQLLAHVAAVEEFRNCEKCQEIGGKIGIVFNCPWFEAYDPTSDSDREAAELSLEFNLGWFLHPLTYGDYPEIMKKTVGNRLPPFSREESQKLKISMDFVGLNYYGAFFSTYRTGVNESQLSYANDHRCDWKGEQKGSPFLKTTSMGIVIYAKGLRSILNYIKNKYKNPEIYIMENGYDEYDDGRKSRKKALADRTRRDFLRDHLWNLEKAVCQDKVKVRGYFFWSLMDNFEWNLGYSTRFGLYYVDYNDGLKRYMRASGKWFQAFLNPGTVITPVQPLLPSGVPAMAARARSLDRPVPLEGPEAERYMAAEARSFDRPQSLDGPAYERYDLPYRAKREIPDARPSVTTGQEGDITDARPSVTRGQEGEPLAPVRPLIIVMPEEEEEVIENPNKYVRYVSDMM